MKKINWLEVKKVFCDLLIGTLFGIAFFGLLFALAEPHMSKGNVVYRETENADLTENNEKEAVLVLVDEKQNTPESPKRIFLGEFKLTAYCSCKKCCGFWANSRPIDENGNDIVIGASGEILKQGISVAVDPSIIPYGTAVYIDGKEYTAHDCGDAINGNRIDVYFSNHQDALDFGVQYANVEIDEK